jgi:hypothetical protein
VLKRIMRGSPLAYDWTLRSENGHRAPNFSTQRRYRHHLALNVRERCVWSAAYLRPMRKMRPEISWVSQRGGGVFVEEQ